MIRKPMHKLMTLIPSDPEMQTFTSKLTYLIFTVRSQVLTVITNTGNRFLAHRASRLVQSSLT